MTSVTLTLTVSNKNKTECKHKTAKLSNFPPATLNSKHSRSLLTQKLSSRFRLMLIAVLFCSSLSCRQQEMTSATTIRLPAAKSPRLSTSVTNRCARRLQPRQISPLINCMQARSSLLSSTKRGSKNSRGLRRFVSSAKLSLQKWASLSSLVRNHTQSVA